MASSRQYPPATLFISSPYDPEAHLGKKRSTLWTGYKVHLTETGEQTLPHLITHVTTTPAPKTDEAMTEQLQEELHRTDLAPGEHLVDAGYVSECPGSGPKSGALWDRGGWPWIS
jgi:transposase